jgi:hypothetical protein
MPYQNNHTPLLGLNLTHNLLDFIPSGARRKGKHLVRPPVLQASPALTGCKAITGAYDILNHLRDALSGAFVCRPAEADLRINNLKTVSLEHLPAPVCIFLSVIHNFVQTGADGLRRQTQQGFPFPHRPTWFYTVLLWVKFSPWGRGWLIQMAGLIQIQV